MEVLRELDRLGVIYECKPRPSNPDIWGTLAEQMGVPALA